MHPPAVPFTVDDLDAMPEHGRRHELIDGVLYVTPVPDSAHQQAVMKLLITLDRCCPDGMHVLLGPLAVRLSDDTELRPDAVVARDEDLTEKGLPVAPALAVEVLTPNTELLDRHTKKAACERAGTPSFWIVDPAEPRLTVFELDDHRRYRTAADVKGDVAFDAERPFPVRVVPAELNQPR
ncbi:Uma2 family endonuclease [Kutzneria buriramensis]|uniref:Uma2 family endonuclease n=1 Tax=Kutzneria buriramensis TaxID=1045776 RepID=A0A3E0HCQ9_9PSEU|nr:Uma2 family endonuclease [Kutzneria buriramensis]REH42640.1 Uma2 family endonuclease [Kutzneria buriramensis]